MSAQTRVHAGGDLESGTAPRCPLSGRLLTKRPVRSLYLSGRSVFPLNGRSGYAKRILTAQNGNMPTSAVRLVPRWGRPNVVTKRSIVLTLTSLIVLAGWPVFAHAARSSIVAEDYMIESGDPGIRLFVRNKHPARMTQYRSEKTVLYVHGSTQAASCTFDLKIAQESWMDYIAGRGYD